jgi:hypothetical protein
VRLRVDPAELRDDLLESLRASSCLGVKQGSNEIEVHLLNSVSERHDRAVLLGCLESWKAGQSTPRSRSSPAERLGTAARVPPDLSVIIEP